MAFLISIRRRSFLVALLLLVTGWHTCLAQSSSPEYKLKAVFLYNFAQFVDWPANAFAETNSPLVIGVLGKDPFGKTLEETVAGEAIKNRRLEIRHFKQASEITGCQVLFISPSHAGECKAILAKIKGRGILTVGDTSDFIEKGGMVRFFTERNKLRFAINLEAAKAGKLSISSKLLQLAEIVSPEKRP